MQYELFQKMYRFVIQDLESRATKEYKRGRRKKAAELRRQADEYYLRAGFMPGQGILPGFKIFM